jgi:hypothetical protein
MKTLVKRISLTGLMLILAACVSVSQTAFTTPEISGVVNTAGMDPTGIQLYLGTTSGTNEPCSAAGAPVSISDEGRFSIPAVTEAHQKILTLNDPAHISKLTALCWRQDQATPQLAALIVTPVSQRVHVKVDCQFSAPLTREQLGNAQVTAPLLQPQFCRAEKS